METETIDLVTMLSKSLAEASGAPDAGHSLAVINRNRSMRFVEDLAGQFRSSYPGRGDVAVLSKHNSANRERFGLNELLFDITVCEFASVESVQHQATLTYATAGLWAVESEFARDSRQALFDFNKLVLSSAKQKLFVGPQVPKQDAFLRVLCHPADACCGEVFVALLPRPREWDRAEALSPMVWVRKERTWVPVGP